MITEVESVFFWELYLRLHKLRRSQFWGVHSSHQTPRRLLEKARACRFLHRRTTDTWATLSSQKIAQSVQARGKVLGCCCGTVPSGSEGAQNSPCCPAALLSLSSGDKSSTHRDWIHSIYVLEVGLLSSMLYLGPFPSPLKKKIEV